MQHYCHVQLINTIYPLLCSVNPAPNSDAWVLATGQDFLPNHLAAGVDFLSFHMWSDNWARTDVPFAYGWLFAHMEDAQTAGRPLVLEEFGKASAPFSAPLHAMLQEDLHADAACCHAWKCGL